MSLTIIGAGLAGSEAAWQAANRDIDVQLWEMRPKKMTKAHKTGQMAELVCSNSFRGADLSNAVGLLKAELRLNSSLIMKSADQARIPAGGALAVDREKFSEYIDETIRCHSRIEVVNEEAQTIPLFSAKNPVILAPGPLVSPALASGIEKLVGQDSLAFFDAISPIILYDSLDMDKVFRQSRYDKGSGDDYLNIPLEKEQYYRFIDDVRNAEKYGGKEEVESDLIENLRPFEGCMPIEEMIERGPDTLLFGPLKPVGLCDPRTKQRPFAVIQLRQDNTEGTLWNMVGMQTTLKQGEQLRIFRSLPGLENAEFARLGSVHRNSFVDSPKCLKPSLAFRHKEGLFFAGQITGTEGYVESTAGGLIAGVNAARMMLGEPPAVFPIATAMGALSAYVSDPERQEFQPMNISFGLMPSYFERENLMDGRKKRKKRERRLRTSERALKIMSEFLQEPVA